MNPHNKQPHPSDNRNLIIFMIISVLLYFAYDIMVAKPHAEAVRAAQAEQAAQLAIEVPNESVDETVQSNEPISVAEATSSAARVSIENSEVKGSVDLVGGRIDHMMLKDYFDTLAKEENINVLAPNGTKFARSVEYGWVSADKNMQAPGKDTRWTIKGSAKTLTPETPVTLSWTSPQKIEFERTLSLDENYLITVEQRIINRSSKDVTFFPYGIISQKGIAPDFEGRFISHEGPIAYVGGELEALPYKKMRKKKRADFAAAEGWTGITDKYWLTVLMPPQGENVKYRFHYSGTPPSKKEIDTGRYQADFTGSALKVAPGQSSSVQSHLFAGPKRVLLLKEYSEKLDVEKLDLSVDFGMFWFFTVPFFYGLHYLALMIGNVGIAIIVLTLIIRMLASPLTYSSYKSFAKMKKVMPQVNALKEKYGEDKQKLQQEMLALYQKEGVNPAAGCFPILLQIPIFFAFYKILFITLEVRHEPFFGWIKDLAAPDPTSLFNLFGLIPWDPPGFLMIGVWPCLMLVAMQIQRRLNPPPTDPIQRDMAMWFPFMMTFIMAQFASGLVIYWTVSAYFGVAQQMIIMRKMGVPIHLFGESHDDDLPEDAVIEGKAEVIKDNEPTKPIKNIKPPKPKKKTPKKKK